MRIGEEVQVRVEGEAIFALLRDHDDEPTAGDAAKLRQRLTELEDVLQHVRADDGVEGRVRERKLFDIRLLEADVGMARASAFLDDEVDAGQRQIGPGALEMVEQEARAAADIEHGLAVNGAGDAIEAGFAVVGFVLDARHALVDFAILAVGDEGDALAEALDVVDQVAPVTAEQPAHRL